MRFGLASDSSDGGPSDSDSDSERRPSPSTSKPTRPEAGRISGRKEREQSAWKVYRDGTEAEGTRRSRTETPTNRPRPHSSPFSPSPVRVSKHAPSPFADSHRRWSAAGPSKGLRRPSSLSDHPLPPLSSNSSSGDSEALDFVNDAASSSDAEDEVSAAASQKLSPNKIALRREQARSAQHAAWPNEAWRLGNGSAYERSLAAAKEHRKTFERIHASTLSSSSRDAGDRTQRALEELSGLLANVDLARRDEERRLRESFEQRERQRADAFERLIHAIEQRDRDAALALQRQRDTEAAAAAAAARRRAEEAAKREAAAQAAKAAERAREAHKAKEVEDASQREASKKEAQPRPAASQPPDLKETAHSATRQPVIDDSEAKAAWDRWTTVMRRVKTEVLPKVAADDRLRAACRHARKSITPKIGQVTNDARQIGNVIKELDRVLSSASAAGGPLAYTWLLNHLSKSLIKQSETEVTAKLPTAFPLARVVVGLLLLGHEDLGDVLMARLVKKCYLLSGHFPRKQSDQDDRAYRKTIGHLADSAGEDGVRYSTRLAGISALWAAIAQTSAIDVVPGLSVTPETVGRIPPHFRVAAIWRLWVSLLRRPIVSMLPIPEALAVIFEIAGVALLDAFGRQWTKVMRLTLDAGIRTSEVPWHKDARPSVVRLEALLEAAERGTPRPLEGRLLA